MKKITCQCGSAITDITFKSVPEEGSQYSSGEAICHDCGAKFKTYKEGVWNDEKEAYSYMAKRISNTFFDRLV